MLSNTEAERRFAQLDSPPIFVVGSARSGTSWVYDILSAPGQVAGVFESWLFSNYAGVSPLFSETHFPSNSSGLGNILEKVTLEAYVRDLVKRIFAHAIEPGHKHLVEKSPSHVFALPVIDRIFPEARIVHVVRDGRDAWVSVQAATRSWAPDWKEYHGASIQAGAQSWQDAILAVRAAQDRLGERLLEVRYEDLRTEPFAEYERLFRFCGIPGGQEAWEQVHQATDFELNFVPDARGFRRFGRVGDWKQTFTASDAAAFHREAGELLIELGYAAPGWQSELT